MTKGLEELKRLAYENACCRCQYHKDGECHNDKGECVWKTIGKELKDYSEIKEIAKHYHWDDFVKDTHTVDTDEKYLRLFNAAIPGIQADYRKARAFEVVGKYVGIEFSKTSAGKPVMWARSKTLGQSWFIHISEEDYESVGDTNKEENS